MLFFQKPENEAEITWIVSGILLLLLFLLPLLLLGSCEKDNNVTDSMSGDEFGVYLIKGAEDYSFLQKKIDELELQDTAWISAADIEIYDYSCHMIYLHNPSAYEPVSVISSPGSRGFVVKVNGKRQYTGTFVPPTSSWIPYASFILYPDIFGCEGSFTIDFSNAGHEDDPRGNETIEQALKKAGIFHGGLAVDLLSAESSSGVLKYTFSITNLDTDDLYVLDPDKTGASLFHYFTNGVYLEKDKKYYYPVREATPYSFEAGYYEMSWMALIPSGKKIVRTTTIENFPRFDPGTYQATFRFPSVYNLSKSDWLVKKSGNHLTRIWTGSITVQKTLTIN